MHSILLFTAKYLIFVIALIAAAYWLTQPNKQKVQLLVYGAIAGVITLALVKTGAALYYDPRPFVSHNVIPIYPHGPDNGFPSDHTVLAAFAAVVVYSVSKRLGIVLFILAVLVGLARVLGHIHSPIDIAGSLLFAIMGGLAASYLTPKAMSKTKAQ